MDGIPGRKPVGERPLYGRFAWAYDLVVARPAGGSAEHLASMLLSCGAGHGSLVLDAGCGTGRYAQGLARFGFRVLGLDRSEALIEVARARSSSATFVCADLLAWHPPEMADAVLCRGVLNDLIADGDRATAFSAFAAWLCPGGVLLADVRDWGATAARYANEPRHERSASRHGRTLLFSSETTLDASRRLMRVRERYTGTLHGQTVDDSYEFAMRCWTAGELRGYIAAAGFTSLQLRSGAEAGIAPDRILVIAHR